MIEILERDIQHLDALESYTSKLLFANDTTASLNLGVRVVWILEVEVDVNGEIEKGFAVALEEHYELSHKRFGEEKVLRTLVLEPTFEIKDYTTIKLFKTEVEARQYAEENHPKTDVVDDIKNLFK